MSGEDEEEEEGVRISERPSNLLTSRIKLSVTDVLFVVKGKERKGKLSSKSDEHIVKANYRKEFTSIVGAYSTVQCSVFISEAEHVIR